nr:YibE/F family protein [Bacilli bacterium]
DTVGGYYFDIRYNMNSVFIGVLLVSVVGTVIDTSISVASAMNEVYENNPKMKDKELYKSGMNVGGDILSTTINTLFFALISVFIGFFMWHRGMNFGEIVNYKLFAEDLMRLLIAFIGSVLIIPVTSYISSRMLISKKSKSFVENVKKKIASAFEE